MALLRKCIRHVVQYSVGYGIGLFIVIASMTCGAMQGNSMSMTAQLSVWAILRILLGEAVFLTGLLVAVTHPFGCALAMGLLLSKSYSAGLGLGWWFTASAGTMPSTALFLVQTLLCTGCTLMGCCVSAYAALRISPLNRQEYIRLMVILSIIQVIGVLMRCYACACAA